MALGKRPLNMRVLLGAVGVLIVLALLAQALRQGVFEPHNSYQLTAPKAQGVRPGVSVEYAGFAIGRVDGVKLGEAGDVEIRIRVNRQYTRWVRADSEFALEQPIVGTPRIVVETTTVREPELPSGATRVLRTSKQLDEVMAKGLAVAEDVKKLLSQDGALKKTLDNVQALTAAMKDKGMLRPALGNDKAADGLLAALTQTAQLTQALQSTLASARTVVGDAGKAVGNINKAANSATQTLQNVDNTVLQARDKALGPNGTLAEVSKTLTGVQANLQALQKTLDNTARVSGDAADATQGLTELRGRVDAISRNVDGMLNDLKRFGVFSRDSETKLP